MGAAFIAHTPQNNITTKTFTLHSSCSVFQAELVAIDQACQWLQRQQAAAAVVMSDSRSALEDINNTLSTHRLTTNIHRTLHNMNTQVTFLWIRAHAGIHGNEAADIAAKSAATQTQPPIFLNFPLSYPKKLAKADSQLKSADIYANNSKGSTIRTWCPTLKHIRTLITKTGQTFALTQLLTNHGYHKEYLHRFHITDNNTCPCDDTTPQTFTHLLTQCPRYTHTRLLHEQYCHYSQNDPYNIEQIITDDSTTNTFMTHLTFIVNTLKKFNNT